LTEGGFLSVVITNTRGEEQMLTKSDRGFLEKFDFREDGRGLLGVEVEYFLAKPKPPFCPAPAAYEFLLGMEGSWGYELSACQVEHHTRPTASLSVLLQELQQGLAEGKSRAEAIGLRLCPVEVAPEDMDLSVYTQDERYRELGGKLPIDILRAASQVAGTHIHFGVGSIEEAIRVHNALAEHTDEFLRMGDHSEGERIRLYRMMAPACTSTPFQSPQHFCDEMRDRGFRDNPRNCWTFVRISIHGTVEVRAFGIPRDPSETIVWAQAIRDAVR